MISRYFVIALAGGVAAWQAGHGAWIEAVGLGALAAGLICLLVADRRQQPALKKLALALFAITLVAMGIVFQRDFVR